MIWVGAILVSVFVLWRLIQGEVESQAGSSGEPAGKPKREGRGGQPGGSQTQGGSAPAGYVVTVTISGLAGALPRASAAIVKGLGFTSLYTVLWRRHGTQRPYYEDAQVRQLTQVNVSFGTWLSATLYAAGKLLEFLKRDQQQNPQGFRTAVLPPGSGGNLGVFNPRQGAPVTSNDDISAIIALCRDSRAQFDLLIKGAVREDAVRLFEQSNLAQALTAISTIGIVYEGAPVKLLEFKGVVAKMEAK